MYHFSSLKANIEKCETAGIGSLKGVKKAVCGLKCVNLSNDTIKILGIHFFYNKKVQMQNNFLITIKKAQQVLCLWNSRTLTFEGRITIFKTLAISKIVYLALIINVPKVIISLQCSWVKKLYEENFHEWKVIPLHLIYIILDQNFKFHSNLSYDTKLLTSFPVFYENIFRYWSQHLNVLPELPSCILSHKIS